MKSHTDRNGNPLHRLDFVLIDGDLPAEVITAGAEKSLLEHRRSDGEAGRDYEWYANERLTIFTEEMQTRRRQQQALAELERSDEAAEERAQEQLDAAYR